MNYSIEFGGDPQDLTIKLSGLLDARSIQAFMQELASNPEFREGLVILADLSELDTTGLSLEEYDVVGDVISGRDNSFPPKAIAIVAPDSRTFDDAMHHRAYQGGSKSGREVFRTRDDATAWLATQR